MRKKIPPYISRTKTTMRTTKEKERKQKKRTTLDN